MIDAIETQYAGCRFRSRLEARWAVAFNTLGIEWMYEPQGYEIDVAGEKRPYLPDFWLPGLNGGIWCEVKGSPENLDLPLLAYAAHPEHGLPGSLAGTRHRGSHSHRLLILGPIPPADDPRLLPTHCALTWRSDIKETGVYSTSVLIVGSLVLGTDLEGPVLGPDGTFYHTKADVWDCVTNEHRGLLRTPAAYGAARMARFEHGETPSPGPSAGTGPVPVGAGIRERLEGLRANHPEAGPR